MNTLIKKSLAAMLAALLALPLFGCSLIKPAQSGFADMNKYPTLYIDGQAYPITREDGIKGLEKVHDGVLVGRIIPEYDSRYDQFVYVNHFYLYSEDAQGASFDSGEKLWISENIPPDYSVNPEGSPSTYCLSVNLKGLPFADDYYSDLDDLVRLLKSNGLFALVSDDGDVHASAYYTDDGRLALESQEFFELMVERVKTNRILLIQLGIAENDEDGIREYVEKNRSSLTEQYAGSELTRALREGTSTMTVTMRITCSKDGSAETIIVFHASKDTIQKWLDSWAPNGIDVVWSDRMY